FKSALNGADSCGSVRTTPLPCRFSRAAGHFGRPDRRLERGCVNNAPGANVDGTRKRFMTPTDDLRAIARDAKLRLLRMHYESRVGHIGGNLSALDILLTLYHRALTADDAFVLSKGHAAGAMYV